VATTRRLLIGTGLLGVLLLPACGAPCEDSLGVYPPSHILVTGIEAVEVPHIAWTCDGFHADSMDPPPSVAPDRERRLQVQVTLEDGSTVEVRFGNEVVSVDPAPVAGVNTWAFQVPDPSQPMIVHICSVDERCAMYWANTYSG
jgi:hypothetical protein